MAKKSRRVRKKGQQIRLSPAQMVQPGDQMAETSTVATTVQPGPKVADLHRVASAEPWVSGCRRVGVALQFISFHRRATQSP